MAGAGRVGLVNRVLAANGWTSHTDFGQRSADIDALVIRAKQRHGLVRADDVVAYVNMALSIHPSFDEHPVAVRALDELGQARRPPDVGDEVTPLDVFLAIDPGVWRRVRKELPGLASIESTL